MIVLFSVILTTSHCHHGYLDAKQAKKSVVKIENPMVGGGTGFELQLPNGHVYTVTNRHVCALKDEKGELQVQSDEMPRPIPRKVLEEDPDSDLCLMEAVPNLPVLHMGDHAPDVDEQVAMIGHPLLQPDTFTVGTMLGIASEVLDVHDCYLLDMNTRPGNSGSPLFNQSGEVIGVVFAGSPYWQGIAVSLDDLKAFVAPY